MRSTTTPVLSVDGLRVSYGGIPALHGVSFDVHPGEIVVLIGGNGAGKTSTMRAVAGDRVLGMDAKGTITFEGRRIDGSPAHKLARAGLAHVPEGRHVFPQSTVEENLLLGGWVTRHDKSAVAAGVEAAYQRFEVLGRRRHQPAGLLSGGEQQMLAIARGLMSKPRFLLLDEPSLGLAPILVDEVFSTVKALAAEGMTILLVEQMANLALEIADHAYVLESGRVTLSGPARSVASDPRVVAAYLGGHAVGA